MQESLELKKEEGHTFVSTMKGMMAIQYIMGRNCVRQFAISKKEALHTIFVATDELVSEFQHLFPRVQKSSKKALESMCGSESHQGVVASLHSQLYQPIDLLKEKDDSLVLIVDSVEDPQNFGSIIRACECFGVAGVIFSRNRGVGLTPTAAKSSTGACALVPLIEVSNLDQAVRTLQEWGYFVYAAEHAPEAKPFHTIRYSEKTAIIVGSEGKGTKQLLRKRADELISIPLFGSVNSLNVSQATAVLLAGVRFIHENK